MRRFGVAGCFAGVFLAAMGAVAPAQESPQQRAQRMAWWREAKFGMFIHWGLYAIPAGVWKGKEIPGIGEWIMFRAHIPVAEYEPLAKRFNPVAFDAREWVRIAREAGMKYIVITTKHHDGFCLFDSRWSEYDIMSTPFRRDIMKELSQEVHRQGLHMGWYHSILDWHHPDYLPRGPGSPRPWDARPIAGASYDRYIEYMKHQLEELLTNYGKIGVLWFDGGWEHPPQEHHAAEVVALLRKLQPQIIINNRLRIPQDYDTPEQRIPATGIPGRDWETCMTMNDTWGYKRNDHHWKSTADLLHKLVDIVSKGGNFLLNVGPTAEGRFPAASVERLAAIGRWMKVNGASIYGTSASPFPRLEWGRCTAKPGLLYLHVFDWPQGGELIVPGLKNPVRGAWLLADESCAALPCKRTGGEDEDVAVTVGARAPDAVDSVVVLQIEGAPEVLVPAVRQDEQGRVLLAAARARIHGEKVRYESGGGLDNIGYWSEPGDWVEWEFSVREPGTFIVALTYACPPANQGGTYVLEVAGRELKGTVSPTGSWKQFETEEINTLKIAKRGRYRLALKPRSIPRGALMNLKAVILKPVR